MSLPCSQFFRIYRWWGFSSLNLVETAARPLHIPRDEAGLVFNVVLEFAAEMLEEALHRQGRGIAEGADRAPHDIAQHAVQQIQILQLAQTVFDAMDNLVHPGSAFPARCALAA